MLESVDLSRPPLSKEEYKPRRDALMEELVVLQQEAVKKGVGLVVLFEGWNGAGKGSRISDLMYNLDARATSVYVTEDLDVKAARSFAGARQGVTGFYPVMQEFWRALGPRGAMTFYDRGWYTAATQHLLYTEFGALSLGGSDGGAGKDGKKAGKKAVAAVERARDERHIDLLHRYLTSAADFEQQLVDDGYVVVKFFVHVGQDAQKKRLERLHDDPATRWRVSKEKLASVRNYAQAYRLYDHLLEGSNFSYAPWHLVNGEDKRAANLAIAETLVEAVKGALAAQPDPAAAEAAAKAQANSAGLLGEAPAGERTLEQEQAVRAAAEQEAAEASARAPRVSRFVIVDDYPALDAVDHSLVLAPDDYKRQIKTEQERLNKLEMEMYQKRIPSWSCTRAGTRRGQGRQHQRVAQALDARAYTVFPSPAPTEAGAFASAPVALLDAPAEGPATWASTTAAGTAACSWSAWRVRHAPSEWGRAYDEINEFERERAGALGRHPAEVLGRREPRRSSCAASATASRIRRSSGRSPTRTGAAISTPVQGGYRGYVPPDVHAFRALDGAGERRQALRSRQGPQNNQRCAGSACAKSEIALP